MSSSPLSLSLSLLQPQLSRQPTAEWHTDQWGTGSCYTRSAAEDLLKQNLKREQKKKQKASTAEAIFSEQRQLPDASNPNVGRDAHGLARPGLSAKKVEFDSDGSQGSGYGIIIRLGSSPPALWEHALFCLMGAIYGLVPILCCILCKLLLLHPIFTWILHLGGCRTNWKLTAVSKDASGLFVLK